MNKIMMAAGAAVLLAGCGPELAEVPYGSKEARWQETLRENYSGYEAPRTAPPAIVDNVSPKLIEEEQLRKGQEDAPAAASDDPAVAVDKAAEKEQAAPAAADKAAGKEQSGKAAKAGDGKEQSPEATVDKAAEKGQAPESAKAEEGRDARDAQYAVDGESYEVQSGDSLSRIAKKFYGDARRYDVIVKANPQLSNPNKLRVGTKILIPKI